MRKPRHILLLRFLHWGLLALCVVQTASAQLQEPPPRLVVMAAVSDNPQQHIAAMRPLADYMASKLAPLGVHNVDILIAENHAQMIRFLLDGRVDWVTETAYSASVLEQQAGAEIILRKWKQGAPDYQSILFVRKDSGIESPSQLTGRSIAFQHPGSTTGYFVPLSMLRREGLNLRALRSVREPPLAGFVNYVFSGAEYNSALWVDKGLVSAGVLSSLDWREDAVVPDSIKQDLAVIYTSPPLPRAVELLRGDLDSRLKAGIRQALLAAHDDPDAHDALLAYHQTLRFDELDEQSLLALREIRNNLRSDDQSPADLK